MLLMRGSQSTGLVSCCFSRGRISLGSAPTLRGLAVTFMYTMCCGGFILGSTSSKAFASLSPAGAINELWKAPLVFSTFACNAPAASAASFSALMAFSVPAQAKPLGKSSLAMTATPFGSVFAASLHNFSNLSLSRPATLSISCLPCWAASCMASPLSWTNFKPSSKVKTPAAQRAEYSPKERPAHILKRVAASAFSVLSFSKPAREATNNAGWQYLVCSSFSSGPLRQRSRRS
mmetsp:Transcript_111250/g.300073  ORF Transcript_111250/g.300073 Transcript_111250/m.300073 type:complete len:234 (-) Transcript_111250:680-1381(-)